MNQAPAPAAIRERVCHPGAVEATSSAQGVRICLKSLGPSTIYSACKGHRAPRKGDIMANWQDPRMTGVDAATVGVPRAARDAGLRSHMLRVYNYMSSGVLLTGIVSLLFFNSGYAERIMLGGGIPAVDHHPVAARDRVRDELRGEPHGDLDPADAVLGICDPDGAEHVDVVPGLYRHVDRADVLRHGRFVPRPVASTATPPSATCRASARS